MNGDLDGFVARPFPDIVRDLLTTLTGGTVREAVVIPPGDTVELRLLADRPIRRISHLEGLVALDRRKDDGSTETVEIPYRFTDVDFELVATGAEGEATDAIRFRASGRRPPVGSTVTVNYYPTQTRPAPITDLNVGSVTRTLLESVGRELALQELHLEQVYKSAYIETAEGANLDKVVALVGISRRPAGVATVMVRFVRAAGSVGRITIPVSTIVSDGHDNRYATATPLILEAGEPSRQVLAAATSGAVEAVEAKAISQMEVLIAGVSEVTNDAPAVAAAAPESDDDLRRRAQGALAVAARGTLVALRFGVLSVEGVKAVTVTEFPNGVSGEIAIDVAYRRDGDAAAIAEVQERIEELKPAGIRVVPRTAQKADVSVTARLTLAGTGVPAADLPALQAQVEERVVAHIQTLPPGGTVRQAQASLVALADPRLVDAEFEFSLGGTPASSVTAPSGRTLHAVQPFTFVVAAESAAPTGSTIQVDVLLPILLRPGVTAVEATSAVKAAAQSWAGTLDAGAAITVDGLVAGVRDESRYAIVRRDATVTTEAAERFLHLTDRVGSHPVGPGDVIVLRNVNVDVREGRV